MEPKMNQEREMTTSDKKITGKEKQGNDGLKPAQATEQTSQATRRSTPDQLSRKEDSTANKRNDTQKEDTATVREITRSNTGTPDSGKTR